MDIHTISHSYHKEVRAIGGVGPIPRMETLEMGDQEDRLCFRSHAPHVHSPQSRQNLAHKQVFSTGPPDKEKE